MSTPGLFKGDCHMVVLERESDFQIEERRADDQVQWSQIQKCLFSTKLSTFPSLSKMHFEPQIHHLDLLRLDYIYVDSLEKNVASTPGILF